MCWLAKKNYKESSKYEEALKEYLLEKGYSEESIDNSLWQSIFEDNEDYKTLIKYLDKKKNDKKSKNI